VEIWDADQNMLLQSFTGQVDYFLSLAFSPDSTRIAAGGYLSLSMKAYALVWSLPGGAALELELNDTSAVLAIAFARDGHLVATGSDSLVFFDADSGQRLGHVQGLVEYGSYWGLLFLTDGDTLAACYQGYGDSTRDNAGENRSVAQIRLLEYPTGRDVRQFIPQVEKGITGGGPFALSQDGARLASVVHEAMVLVWDLR
jgi:WD40 repeat protein